VKETVMEINEYYMELYAKGLLAEARAAAARRALVGPAPPIVVPALRAAVERMRALYLRWSSAASAGSKPTTARAWSRSR
jgi:hypothetical protein